MVNFGPLAAEILSLVWGTPGNFNGFRVLAALLHGTLVVGVSQTAALNRGRHLYSAGRPSRWALAHISSYLWTWVSRCFWVFLLNLFWNRTFGDKRHRLFNGPDVLPGRTNRVKALNGTVNATFNLDLTGLIAVTTKTMSSRSDSPFYQVFLHLSLSDAIWEASSIGIATSVQSSLMLSIHLFFGLPFPRNPCVATQ